MPSVDVEKKRAAQKRWYYKNRERHIANTRVIKARQTSKLREYVWKVKSDAGCSRCPENDPACLDFHHLGKKYKDVSTMSFSGVSLSRIKHEIEKCIVLCKNCHAKEHATVAKRQDAIA